MQIDLGVYTTMRIRMLREKLKGLRAELESESNVEVLSFHEFSVSATLGTKDGPVTAPILEYKVTSSDSLVIEGLFPIIWENIEFGNGTISVVRNGEVATYNASKSPK